MELPHLTGYPARLDEPCPTLDGALYIASCLCGADPHNTAHIYITTDAPAAHPSTGEMYRVITGAAGRDLARDAVLPPPARWRHVYTITRGER